VVQHFMDDPEVKAMYSYSLLLRVLNEQCRVKETADGQLVDVECHDIVNGKMCQHIVNKVL